jgi:hypothetical protein
MSDPIPADELLPCGCLLKCSVVDGVNTLTYIPCSQTCVHYLNTIDLAQDANKPVTKKVR